MGADVSMMTWIRLSGLLSIFAFFCVFADGQQLPDAPSAVKSLDAKHCYLSHAESFEEVPCSSMPEIFDDPKPGFFIFRKLDAPALRTNKQELRSKMFLIVHGLAFAAVIADIKHTHGARETWGSELPAVAGITGMDYVLDRFVSRSLSFEAPIYAIIHYTRDALR